MVAESHRSIEEPEDKSQTSIDKEVLKEKRQKYGRKLKVHKNKVKMNILYYRNTRIHII